MELEMAGLDASLGIERDHDEHGVHEIERAGPGIIFQGEGGERRELHTSNEFRATTKGDPGGRGDVDVGALSPPGTAGSGGGSYAPSRSSGVPESLRSPPIRTALSGGRGEE